MTKHDHHEIPVRSHLEEEIKDVCAYCGRQFAKDEAAIEREVNGRRWRFCSDACYQSFMDAIHFEDEDLDSYDPVVVGSEDEEQ